MQGLAVKIAAVLIGLLASIFFANKLPVEYYGEYLLVIKYVNLFVALSYLGLDKLIIKLSEGDSHIALKGTVLLVILLVFSILYYLIYAVSVTFFNVSSNSYLSFCLMLCGPLLFLPKTAYSVLLVRRKVNLALIIDALLVSSTALIIFYAIKNIYIATLASWLIAAIVSMIVIYKYTVRTGLDWFSKEKIRSATNFYLSGLSHMSYSTFTLIIVGSVLSNTDVAIYSVVSRLTLITILFQQVYTSIYSVEFRYLFQKAMFLELRRVSRRLSIQLLIISLIVTVALFQWGELVLSFWGNEYSEQGFMAFKILLVAGIVNSWYYLKGTILNMSNNEVFMRQTGIAISVMGILLTYLMAKHFGIIGASLSYLFTVTLEGVIRSLKVRTVWE